MPTIPDFPVPSAGVLKKPKEMSHSWLYYLVFTRKSIFQVVFLPGFHGIETFNNYINSRNQNAGRQNISVNIINKGPWPNGFCKAFWDGLLHS